jgi:hypothetical protein
MLVFLACWFFWHVGSFGVLVLVVEFVVYVGIKNAENVSRQSPASRWRFCCCVLAACKRSFINSRDVIQGDLFPFMVQHDSMSWMKYKNYVCVPFRQMYSIIDTYPRASRISTSSVLKALHVDQVSLRAVAITSSLPPPFMSATISVQSCQSILNQRCSTSITGWNDGKEVSTTSTA